MRYTDTVSRMLKRNVGYALAGASLLLGLTGCVTQSYNGDDDANVRQSRNIFGGHSIIFGRQGNNCSLVVITNNLIGKRKAIYVDKGCDGGVDIVSISSANIFGVNSEETDLKEATREYKKFVK